MKLREFVSEHAIVPRLKGVTREDAIVELVDALVAGGVVSKSLRKDLITSVMEREKRGSTGFGKGVAVPHVKHAGIPKMSAAVGVSERGIDFSALDKQPVYSVFLLLSPADKPDEHLQAMEIIFRNLSQDKFRRFLRQATTTQDVLTLLEDADNHALG